MSLEALLGKHKGLQHKYLRSVDSLELAQQKNAKIKDVTASQVVFTWALVKTTWFFYFTDINVRTVLTMTVLCNVVVDMTLFQGLSIPSTLWKPTVLFHSGLWSWAALTALVVMVRSSISLSIFFHLLNSFNILSCMWRCERRGIPWTRLPVCHKTNTHLNHFCHMLVCFYSFVFYGLDTGGQWIT